MNKLIEHIKNSELVQAAITEAVHRFYMDRITSTHKQDVLDLKETECSDVLSTLWNLTPNWRYTIQKAGARYRTGAPNINNVSIFGKPKKIVGVNLEIKIS
jgi:ethanolamine ammonia-lyase small subunit